MTATHARIVVYILGALTGAFLVGLGAIRGDASLITAGLGLLGVGTLASANTHPPELTRSGGDHAAD